MNHWETTSDSAYEITLAALDIKDAFLQVPQENLVEVSLYNQKYIIKRNLPGQRLGAKAWYWFFRDYATNALQCEWSVETTMSGALHKRWSSQLFHDPCG